MDEPVVTSPITNETIINRLYKMEDRLKYVEDQVMGIRVNVLMILGKFAPNPAPDEVYYKKVKKPDE